MSLFRQYLEELSCDIQVIFYLSKEKMEIRVFGKTDSMSHLFNLNGLKNI